MLSSLDAERAVIAAVLLDNKHLGLVDVQVADFERLAHRDTWAAILAVAKTGKEADPLTVSDHLKAHGSSVTWQDIDKLVDGAVTANPKAYAKTVKECAHARRMIDGMRGIAGRLKGSDSPQDVAQDLGSLAGAAGSGTYREGSVNEGVQAIIDCQEGNGAEDVVRLGVSCFEEYEPSLADLTIIAGRPSMGKTATCLFLAERQIDMARPTLFISAESNSNQIVRRRLSYMARISVGNLRRKGGVESADEWNRLTSAVDRMKKTEHLFRVYEGRFTGHDLEVIIRAEIIRSGIQSVFIDHLGKIRLDLRLRNDIAIGNVTESLAALSKEKRIPIFLAHQLSRRSDQRDNKRPAMSDLRDSGRIEQDADNLWLLHREERHSAGSDDTLEIIIPKHRDGPIGTVDSLRMVCGRVEEK